MWMVFVINEDEIPVRMVYTENARSPAVRFSDCSL